MKKKHLIGLTAVLLAAVLFGLHIFPMESDAFSVQDRIRGQLDSIGIVDAVREETLDETLADENFMCYSSAERDMLLFFSGETGILRWVDTMAAQTDAELLSTRMSEAELLAQSREWAELLLGQNQIGELELTEATEDEVIFTEYYEGQPTGTSVTVYWEGRAMTSTITYIGEIFVKNELGQVVPKNEGEMLPQEQAIALGLEYIAPNAAGYELDQDTVLCERKIFRGTWVYQIRVESAADEGGFSTRFTAVIDPWTGELIETRRSL